MIQSFEKVESTSSSHPFASAYEKCGFKRKGYVEEEYFMHGAANVYEWQNGKRKIAVPDCPYVNRLLVRRPESRGCFSGNVVVEILNSTSFIDFDRCWALTYRHMMRNGDIYIGITSKPNVIPAMLKVDEQRYHTLEWKNPRLCQNMEVPENKLGNMEGASSPETEDGLFWDMLTDLAILLRDGQNPLIGSYAPYYQYLAGWSQSGAYMIRFVNDFAYEKKMEQPYFDGYFSAGSASSCMPDLNQLYGQTGIKQSRRLKQMTEPFIEMHTESENVKWGNDKARGDNDSDADMKYRIYDVVGTTHDSRSTMIDYYVGDRDVFLCGITPNYPGKEIHPNAVPYEVAFHAALQFLYEWVRDGKEPPIIPPIETVGEKNVTDDTGNAVGGYRLPFVEAPLCIYHPVSTPMKPDFAFGCTLFGYEENYSHEKVLDLYGSYHKYMKIFNEKLDEAVKAGIVLETDKNMCLKYAREKARQIF